MFCQLDLSVFVAFYLLTHCDAEDLNLDSKTHPTNGIDCIFLFESHHFWYFSVHLPFINFRYFIGPINIPLKFLKYDAGKIKCNIQFQLYFEYSNEFL